jgi:glycoprotein 6-alpha-L-fucosyltransferase
VPGTLWTWTDIKPRPAYLPSGLPEDLVYRLDKLNSQHSSWWVGQVYQFALKLTPFAQNAINDTMNKLNFKKPIVAVQG